MGHYARYGEAEGRQPHPRFDGLRYLALNPDLQSCGVLTLAHYLRDGKDEGRPTGLAAEIGQLLALISTTAGGDIQKAPLVSAFPVDIIIPVYNGMQYLPELFDSLFANTSYPHRVIVVNDCSPDPAVAPYLQEQLKGRENCLLLQNEKNLGFVRSVGRGAAESQRDMVLLNSDVIVPPGWLERLMAPIWNDRDRVASTTPFSNAATIFSFPQVNKDNVLPTEMSVNVVSAVFSHMPPAPRIPLEVPTGCGFCMGINRKTWDAVGGLDESTFAEGYGEENDWCQRSIHAGWSHQLVPNLFVHHVHGGSFPSEKKRALIERNSKILAVRWPGYFSSVERHCALNPWKSLRDYAMLRLLLMPERRPVLILSHALGGGADAYRKK